MMKEIEGMKCLSFVPNFSCFWKTQLFFFGIGKPCRTHFALLEIIKNSTVFGMRYCG